MKKISSLLILLSCSIFIFSQIPADSMYFGQTPPGNTPVIFAPGVISKVGRYEHDISFSPDGKEMFFSLSSKNWASFSILQSKWENNKWATPVTAEFSKQYKNTEIIFSPDGKNLYFASSRAPGVQPWDFGIFKITKEDNIWSTPTEIGLKALQPEGNDGNWHPGISNDSTVYFSSARSGSYDIYRSTIKNGVYSSFENLGSTINSSFYNDWYPWVSPDNSYLIFSSERPGGFGDGDLYISFQNNSGVWSTPVNLGKTVNSSDIESSPRISPDGKYLFFTRTKNWDGDFYWVSTSVIEGLNPTNISKPISNEPNIQCYPNPTKDKINIAFGETPCNDVIVEIVDVDGKLILTKTYQNTSQATIDLTGNAKGIYFLNLNVEGKILSKKICLE